MENHGKKPVFYSLQQADFKCQNILKAVLRSSYEIPEAEEQKEKAGLKTSCQCFQMMKFLTAPTHRDTITSWKHCASHDYHTTLQDFFGSQ